MVFLTEKQVREYRAAGWSFGWAKRGGQYRYFALLA